MGVARGSWGEWLRYLPLQPAGTPALTYTGKEKDRQDVVAAVVNIDMGAQDPQHITLETQAEGKRSTQSGLNNLLSRDKMLHCI